MSDQIWVKVCGLTRPEDVDAAIAAGTDAVGLILVERSPRSLDVPRAAELATLAHGRAQVVVLVEGDAQSAVHDAVRINADAVQPYGDEAAAIAEAAEVAGLATLFPVPIDGGAAIDLATVPAGAIPLLDSAVAGRSGGSGQPFEWSLARDLDGVVIAGGLTVKNVSAAIASAQPYGVDASSGLEAAVGEKDHVKVADFVAAARAAAAV